MDMYKNRRVLTAVDAPRTQNLRSSRAFEVIPFHEQLANARRERADRELFDAQAVESFLANGGKIKACKPTAKLVRREQRFGRVTIPAIHQPIMPVKGGAVSYCAPRSRG